MELGSNIQGLPPCTECGATRGDYCRTKDKQVLLPPCRARMVAEIEHLRAQRDRLQGESTDKVLERRELRRAAQYVLDNVDGYSGIRDHLRNALGGP